MFRARVIGNGMDVVDAINQLPRVDAGSAFTDPSGSDGTITLTFDDCSSGLIEYDITSIGQQGSVPIQRITDDNIALCEALGGE